MKFKKGISIDFDGVLHSYTSGWDKPWVILDPPVPGALEFLREAYESELFKLYIFSSRSKHPLGRLAMKSWMRKHLKEYFGMQAGPYMDPLYLEIYESLHWPWFKPITSFGIDDRIKQFQGVFPSVEEMRYFKPWKVSP